MPFVFKRLFATGKPAKNWDSTLNLPQTSLPIRAKLNDSEFLAKTSTELYQKISSRSDSSHTFNLIDGPPFANGNLHVGHALNKFLKDTILRYRALMGDRIEFRPGWDCHGLPIELKALQKHKSEQLQGLDPLEIRRICREFALEAVKQQMNSMQKWGLLADYERPLLTIDPQFEANQLRVLAKMAERGLIYSAKKPVFYSPSSKTALAEAELEYSDDHVSLTTLLRLKARLPDSLKSRIKDENVFFLIWTTTPWTLPANRALAVGADISYSLARHNDVHYLLARSRVPSICASLQHALDIVHDHFCWGAELSGAQYEMIDFNSFGREHRHGQVLLAEFVTEDSGTGVVHLAPEHGMEDYEACKASGIKLEATSETINDSGDFNESAPMFLRGFNVFSGASESVLEFLKCSGHYLKASYLTHRYPYDWRTQKPIIQRATRQWFASIESILPELEASLESVDFIPPNGKDKMLSMLRSRTDWCISRQRHWGLSIPAFTDAQDVPHLNPEVIRFVADRFSRDGSDIWWTEPMNNLLPPSYSGMFEAKCFDTLDVWFDSGSLWSNFSSFPGDLYLEGSDQYRGWFQSSLITSVATTGKAPFRRVVTHGFALDQENQKMSKSRGNVVDPDGIVNAEGSDLLRLWSVGSNYTNDVSVGPEIIKQVAENKRKIRNTMRFALSNLSGFNSKKLDQRTLRKIDQLMLARLNQVMQDIQQSYDRFDFAAVLHLVLKFCSSDLSSFYFDLIKDRLYTEPMQSPLRQGAQAVLLQCLDSLNFAITPIMPLLSQEIYSHYRTFLGPSTSAPVLMSERLWSKCQSPQDQEAVLEFSQLQRIRGDFLEWFGTRGKKEFGARNTFQLDLVVNDALPLSEEEELRELFGVASVRKDLQKTESWIDVRLSNRQRCHRCLTFDLRRAEDDMCVRCLDQLNQNTDFETKIIAE